jgi:prepilin-type N-terminal cleavage/methylation domain-containing protein
MQPIANKIAKKQAGYSLVELSVALAIVAVILVGGLMGTRQILLTNNVNNQLKDSAQVIAKITRQFQNALTTSGATNENLVPLSYWPQERFTNTSTNKWHRNHHCQDGSARRDCRHQGTHLSEFGGNRQTRRQIRALSITLKMYLLRPAPTWSAAWTTWPMPSTLAAPVLLRPQAQSLAVMKSKSPMTPPSVRPSWAKAAVP